MLCQVSAHHVHNLIQPLKAKLKVIQPMTARSKAYTIIEGTIKDYAANGGKIKKLFNQRRRDQKVI